MLIVKSIECSVNMETYYSHNLTVSVLLDSQAYRYQDDIVGVEEGERKSELAYLPLGYRYLLHILITPPLKFTYKFSYKNLVCSRRKKY